MTLPFYLILLLSDVFKNKFVIKGLPECKSRVSCFEKFIKENTQKRSSFTSKTSYL